MLLAAGLLWLGDFLSPSGTAAVRDLAAAAERDEDADEELEGFLNHKLSVSDALREWMGNLGTVEDGPRDDPFLDVASTAKPSGTAPAMSGGADLVPPPLRAISLGASQPLAVLGNSVVGVGDSIGPWRVDGIEMDTVWVLGPGGRVGLQISRDPSRPPDKSKTGGTQDTAMTQAAPTRKLPDPTERARP